MKRILTTLMTIVCILSLTACKSNHPSLEEVEKAISDGTVTVEDALEKGWVSKKWAETYYEKNSVAAADKSKAYNLGEFSAQTVSGETYTNDNLTPVMYFAFFDPSNADAENSFQKLCDANDTVEKNGGKILVFSMSETKTEIFENAPFPVLLYNDSVKEALPDGTADFLEEILHESSFTGNWYADGYFQQAWSSSIDTDELAQNAKELSSNSANENSNSENDGEAAGKVG